MPALSSLTLKYFLSGPAWMKKKETKRYFCDIKKMWTEPWPCHHAKAARNAPFPNKGLLVPYAVTFQDKLILDESHSRQHKGPPPSFETMAESMGSHSLTQYTQSGIGLSWYKIHIVNLQRSPIQVLPSLTSVISHLLVYPTCHALALLYI